MTKIRFIQNQCGVYGEIEIMINGERSWRGFTPILKPENYGGLDGLKKRCLAAVLPTQNVLPPQTISEHGETLQLV